ncbi:MAG: NifB/NifX family molybdenum-iron cluster-binding protein [Deltaproteobacteria bacterium]|nr:NifB/NifX family molybdenum-iron cluster-binding protein [Deltaproteobacteria bacterium]
MKIAIPVSGDRVSTVFDTADELFIIESKAGMPPVETKSLKGTPVIAKAAMLKTLDIQVLICGALPRPVEYMIETAGIRVIPFIRGTAEEVFAAFLKDNLDDHIFVMPGCRRQQIDTQTGLCRRGRAINGGGRNKK